MGYKATILLLTFLLLLSVLFNAYQYSAGKTVEENIISVVRSGCWSKVDFDTDGTLDLLILDNSDLYSLSDMNITYVGKVFGDVFYFNRYDSRAVLSARADYGTGVSGILLYNLSDDASEIISTERYDCCYLPSIMDKPEYSHDDNPISEEEYEEVLRKFCSEENKLAASESISD